MTNFQPTARRSHALVILSTSLIISGLTVWAVRHIASVANLSHNDSATLAIIWLLTFVALAWNNVIATFERPKTANRYEVAQLNKLTVVAIVPVYNEDPALLRHCLASLLRQSRKPDKIIVVDDGSHEPYDDLVNKLSIDDRFIFRRTPNRGKRHAQAVGVRLAPDADIYLTVDSDTVLERKAIYEGLKPFADPKVMSVAGVCLPINNHENLLTRFIGLWWVVWQLVDRSSQSTFGCVTVNSGILAFYRGHIVRRYLKAYLSETFFGRPVHFSDDSLLTTYALLHGKTLQQPSCIGFTAIPENVSHHLRQFCRWSRGSFIRSWWRFKYLPLNSYVWWWHFFRWVQFFMATATFVWLSTTGTYTNKHLLPYFFLIAIMIAYGQALRYLTVRRSDESFGQQLTVYMTAPLMGIWTFFVLRFVRWYAYATCLKNGWGTRAKVEVGLK